MAINVSGELFAATSKGKLGSASQIFLSGDTENVEDKLNGLVTSSSESEEKITELTEQNTLVNSLIEELQEKIEELNNSIKRVEESAVVIEVLTPEAWEALNASGQVKSGVFYGILEEGSVLPEENENGQAATIEEGSEIISLIGATYNEEEELIELIGSFDSENEILTLGSSSTSGGNSGNSNQGIDIADDTMTVISGLSEEESISLLGELDESGEVLTITI